MAAVSSAEAIADCGLRGDRYAEPGKGDSPDHQLTLIELECIEAFARVTGLPLAPHEPRRNLVTFGARLNELRGKRFRIGEAELEGMELCEPCATFARRTHAEVVRFFVHRGGLRCRILRGGLISMGDDIVDGA
jgi:MOSC domain-containing protein YiiM